MRPYQKRIFVETLKLRYLLIIILGMSSSPLVSARTYQFSSVQECQNEAASVHRQSQMEHQAASKEIDYCADRYQGFGRYPECIESRARPHQKRAEQFSNQRDAIYRICSEMSLAAEIQRQENERQVQEQRSRQQQLDEYRANRRQQELNQNAQREAQRVQHEQFQQEQNTARRKVEVELGTKLIFGLFDAFSHGNEQPSFTPNPPETAREMLGRQSEHQEPTYEAVHDLANKLLEESNHNPIIGGIQAEAFREVKYQHEQLLKELDQLGRDIDSFSASSSDNGNSSHSINLQGTPDPATRYSSSDEFEAVANISNPFGVPSKHQQRTQEVTVADSNDGSAYQSGSGQQSSDSIPSVNPFDSSSTSRSAYRPTSPSKSSASSSRSRSIDESIPSLNPFDTNRSTNRLASAAATSSTVKSERYREENTGIEYEIPAGYTLYRDSKNQQLRVVNLSTLSSENYGDSANSKSCSKNGLGRVTTKCEMLRNTQHAQLK